MHGIVSVRELNGVSISALAPKGLKHDKGAQVGQIRDRGLNQRPSSEGIETLFLRLQCPRRYLLVSISALAPKGLKRADLLVDGLDPLRVSISALAPKGLKPCAGP